VNGDSPAEDLTILAALAALERGGEPLQDAARPDEASETLARLYAEVLGLVPFELDPVAPPAGAKARMMAAIRGGEPRSVPAVEPVRAPVPVTVQEPRSVPRAPLPGPAAPPASSSRRWPLALAAALALALLGLSWWLYSQIGAQRATIAGLRHELALERARSGEVIAKVRQLENEGYDLREDLTVVTSRAVLVSPMRPMGQPPLQPEAHGMLFVAADHQHWFMSLQGLQPAPEGQVYKLWFVADRPVGSGSFTARPGEPLDLGSKTMPAGTKGAIVTLEHDPSVPAPTGPTILQAAPPYQAS
jgi:hypothetical protein